MPRKTASERHLDTAPPQQSWPPEGDDLVEALMAVHHPTRRRLLEILGLDGPAAVGTLAARTGLAPGSVSHHLKALHRAGFVEPAPGLARDSRESWWRALDRRLSWSTDAYAPGTGARAVAELAEQANLEHHNRAVVHWMRTRATLPEPWRKLGFATDNLVPATPEQFAELESRLAELIHEWDAACRADAEQRPDLRRFPVRLVARLFPSEPA